jgi:hypothetical protein
LLSDATCTATSWVLELVTVKVVKVEGPQNIVTVKQEAPEHAPVAAAPDDVRGDGVEEVGLAEEEEEESMEEEKEDLLDGGVSEAGAGLTMSCALAAARSEAAAAAAESTAVVGAKTAENDEPTRAHEAARSEGAAARATAAESEEEGLLVVVEEEEEDLSVEEEANASSPPPDANNRRGTLRARGDGTKRTYAEVDSGGDGDEDHEDEGDAEEDEDEDEDEREAARADATDTRRGAKSHGSCPKRKCIFPRGLDLAAFCENYGDGRLAHLPKEWAHPTALMASFTRGSGKKVPWKCGECGNEWEAAIYNCTDSDRPRGCPQCSMSRGSKRKVPWKCGE